MEWRRLCVSEMLPLDVRVVVGRIWANGWHSEPCYAMGGYGVAWHRFGELLLCGRGDAKLLLVFERSAHRRLCGCAWTLVKRGSVVERVRSGFGNRFTTACAAGRYSDLSERLIIAAHAAFASNPS